ncbi:hypothetical protein [Reichenbachiella ulvae]|uniref:Uncharacterized protein n=1 Tax=Reichenbachiella ulvae TaxID=2980104 RepID=A0ABT3CZZ8_9BACT|nr:hypothetical protein [Reichenbachiella ulvae]MCV9389138.1 hypothetical protein [Reichenbachiella ulvae]
MNNQGMNHSDKDIEWLDQFMEELPMEEANQDFTMRIVSNAALLKKRQANQRLIYWVLGFLLLGMSICVFFALGIELSFEMDYLPEYKTWWPEEPFAILDGISMEFLLAVEGLLALFLVDKLLTRTHVFRRLGIEKK